MFPYRNPWTIVALPERGRPWIDVNHGAEPPFRSEAFRSVTSRIKELQFYGSFFKERFEVFFDAEIIARCSSLPDLVVINLCERVLLPIGF